MTETARTGPSPGLERDTAVEALIGGSSVAGDSWLAGDLDQAGTAARTCQ
jgi:hypothetical protein